MTKIVCLSGVVWDNSIPTDALCSLFLSECSHGFLYRAVANTWYFLNKHFVWGISGSPVSWQHCVITYHLHIATENIGEQRKWTTGLRSYSSLQRGCDLKVTICDPYLLLYVFCMGQNGILLVESPAKPGMFPVEEVCGSDSASLEPGRVFPAPLTSWTSEKSQARGIQACTCTCRRIPPCACSLDIWLSAGLRWELGVARGTWAHTGPLGRTTAHLPYRSEGCCCLEDTGRRG